MCIKNGRFILFTMSFRNQNIDFSGNGHLNAGMKNGGYNWSANAKLGVSADGKNYVGPTYSGVGGGNKYGSAAYHQYGAEYRHYSSDGNKFMSAGGFTSNTGNKGFGIGIGMKF